MMVEWLTVAIRFLAAVFGVLLAWELFQWWAKWIGEGERPRKYGRKK